MIAALCFDLFETLITEYVADYKPSPTMAERLQIDPAHFGRAWAELTPAKFRGEVPDFPTLLRTICHQVGGPAPEAIIAQLHAERVAEKERPFAQIDPRILAMLTTLRQGGLKLALISNASSEEVTAWQQCDLAPFFDTTIFSFAVGKIKPEAEIYWMACEALVVEPSATWFIGDGSSDELAGAERAGVRPYWATWFLDQWPLALQLSRRQQNEQFTRLAQPADLLAIVAHAQVAHGQIARQQEEK